MRVKPYLNRMRDKYIARYGKRPTVFRLRPCWKEQVMDEIGPDFPFRRFPLDTSPITYRGIIIKFDDNAVLDSCNSSEKRYKKPGIMFDNDLDAIKFSTLMPTFKVEMPPLHSTVVTLS